MLQGSKSRERWRQGYRPLEGEEGQDPMGRSTRISIGTVRATTSLGKAPRLTDEGDSNNQDPITLGFASGRAAAESLKKSLAERAHGLRTSFAEKAEVMRKSKAQTISRSSSGNNRSSAGPGQMALRQKDKFVPLPDAAIGEGDDDDEDEDVGTGSAQDLLKVNFAVTSSAPESHFASLIAELEMPGQDDLGYHEMAPLLAPGTQAVHHQGLSPTSKSQRGLGATGKATASRGRITVYCMADALDRVALIKLLKASYKAESIHQYIDVIHLRIDDVQKNPVPDTFFFDYGVIICWGLDESDEEELVKRIDVHDDSHLFLISLFPGSPLIGKVCEIGPYQPEDIEIDEFQFNFSANEPPHIQNDMITINKRQASDHQVRLAISHALAQSIKLSIYEGQVMELVEETKDLPEGLAKYGRVEISSKNVAKLIGKVFLQSSTVNLLSSVLDTPEYFWYAPDSLQALYERACEYLELETRVDVLNARFQVLQEMLDMLRDHKNNQHASRLEWIIIWLLVVDVFLMVFQLLGLFGFV